MKTASIAPLLFGLGVLAGCGGSTDAASSTTNAATTTATTATGGGAAGQGGSQGEGGSGGTAASGGAGGAGGTTATGGMGGAGGADFTPTPADIHYGAHLPLPAGESIVFDDWNSTPNRVLAMKPDGTAAAEVFRAYRVWSLGATPDGAKVAFACGDPKQKEHYGLDLGDAIQHSWVYDAATQTIELVAKGNINDECHVFGADRSHLYVCRRYDFQPDFSSKGYRIGRIDLATLGFEWLTDDGPTMTLYPAPTADEATLFFARIAVVGGKQQTSIVKQPLPPGAVTPVRTNASAPRLSPDGQRLLYTDYGAQGTLWTSKLDGSDPVKVADRLATNAHWSPDGARVAYLLYDGPNNCQHVEVVKADGSEAGAPARIRDCAGSGEFVTALAWISR